MNRHDRSTAHAALLASVTIAFGALAAGCAKQEGTTPQAADNPPAVPAAPAETDHAEHSTGGAAIEQLALDAGHKWATDAPLRAGMAAIHEAFDADHAAIDAGSMGDAQYDALAGRIDAQVQDIIRNCKLPPAADANLHYIIADLTRGAQEMRGGAPARTRHDGAVLVHGALDAYGKFFDDPAP
ncbi:MAG: hypothetical protein CMLOHMNK_01614 [Steroidobacteraceae bacterium]|nr:hypothetical protein [Steroidobacteraceae bacterium]